MNNPATVAWLLDAATFLGLALITICFVYGLALLLLPEAAQRAAERLNRRYSARQALRPLEIPRSTERFFYRHHRLVGALLLAGVAAFYLLYFFDYPRDTVLARLAVEIGKPLAEVFSETASRFFLIANVFIGVFALLMLWRPSLLKPVEDWANHWFSTRRALRDAEHSHEVVDRAAARFPRLAGALILVGTAYVGFGILALGSN